jgi:hypothetical protein
VSYSTALRGASWTVVLPRVCSALKVTRRDLAAKNILKVINDEAHSYTRPTTSSIFS